MKDTFRTEEELQEGPPAGGHRERFLQRLQEEESKKKGKVRFMPWLIGLSAIAAVILAFVTIGIPNTGGNEMAEEVKFNPYTHMDERTQQLEAVFATHVKPQLAIVGQEAPELSKQIALLEQLEDEYARLKSLLEDTNEQKKITSEMIRNHRMRLKLMDQLLLQIQIINEQKTSNDAIKSI